jgi:hypothetical protein
MSAQSPTWSFKDCAASVTSPALGGTPITFAGGVGAGEFTLTMDTVRTTHETSADSTVLPSYIAGDSGRVSIRILQTSEIHTALLDLYNLVKSQADSGNSSNWASTQASVRNLTLGRQWNCSGGSFEKIPDYPFAAQGQYVTWVIMFCSINQM